MTLDRPSKRQGNGRKSGSSYPPVLGYLATLGRAGRSKWIVNSVKSAGVFAKNPQRSILKTLRDRSRSKESVLTQSWPADDKVNQLTRSNLISRIFHSITLKFLQIKTNICFDLKNEKQNFY